jgi:hypothetical protein
MEVLQCLSSQSVCGASSEDGGPVTQSDTSTRRVRRAGMAQCSLVFAVLFSL